MLWIIDKFVTEYELELPFLRVKIPIRVEIEYRKERGEVVELKRKYLFNREYILKRLPEVDGSWLEDVIRGRVDEAIREYFEERGLSCKI